MPQTIPDQTQNGCSVLRPLARRRTFAALTFLCLVPLCAGWLHTDRAYAQTAPLPGWQASWIEEPGASIRDGAEIDGSRPMPVFRREFMVRDRVRQATLRIAGLGQFEAHLGSAGTAGSPKGGLMIGGAGLHQSWTDYRKTIRFETFDLTGDLHLHTPMVLSVLLGNGMFNVERSSLTGPGSEVKKKARYSKFEGTMGSPKLFAELTITYADGRVETIATGPDWQVAHGPVVFDSTYGGEDEDGGWQEPDWNSPATTAFRKADWKQAQTTQSPGGKLLPELAPPVLIQETYLPVKQTEPKPGTVVYDLGQNFAGIPAIEVSGPAGATLRLTPGELLTPEGVVTQRSSGTPMWWSYRVGGASASERWQPRFGFYGFRYLQAEWTSPAKGKIERIEGKGLHSTSPATGTFESSVPQLNRIHALIVAAMHNNEFSLFTDCPHREKLGWLEETHLVAEALLYNNDLRGLFAATDANMADEQKENGIVPTIAPQYTKFPQDMFNDTPEWGGASVLAPWAVYRFFGEPAELERMYPTMQRWTSYLAGRAVDGIVAYGLGDWYDIGPGPNGLEKNTTLGVTGTLTLLECAQAMEHIATVLHKQSDAEHFRSLAETTAAAYNRRFWDAAHGWYDTGSQTANAMPLALGAVPAERRAAVLQYVVDDLRKRQDHVTAGEVGYPYLLHALMANGEDDEILRMMLRTDPPSYGSQLAAGATSLTEAWDANRNNSQDHFMLGAGDEWFYRGLGGIDLDMSRPIALLMKPALVEGVDWVKCGYISKLGRIESDWKRTAQGVEYDILLPVAAQVRLPGRRVVEAGKPVANLAHDGAFVSFHASPGHHHYVLQTAP